MQWTTMHGNEVQGRSQDLREGGAWDEWFVRISGARSALVV